MRQYSALLSRKKESRFSERVFVVVVAVVVVIVVVGVVEVVVVVVVCSLFSWFLFLLSLLSFVLAVDLVAVAYCTTLGFAANCICWKHCLFTLHSDSAALRSWCTQRVLRNGP